jgi:hypothetical protein
LFGYCGQDKDNDLEESGDIGALGCTGVDDDDGINDIVKSGSNSEGDECRDSVSLSAPEGMVFFILGDSIVVNTEMSIVLRQIMSAGG